MAELTYFSTFFRCLFIKNIYGKSCVLKKKCLTFVKSKGLTLWLFRF